MKRTLSLLAVLLGLTFVTAWAQDPAATPDAVPQPVKLTAEEQQHVLDEMAKLVGRWKVVEVRQQEHTETPVEYTLEFQLIADRMLVIVRCQGQVSTMRTSVYPPNMMLSGVDVHAQRQHYMLQGVYQFESPTRLRLNQSMIGYPKSIDEAGLSCIHLTLEKLPDDPASPTPPAKEVITGRDIEATEHPFGHPIFTQAIRTDDRIIKAIEHLPLQERGDAFLKSYGLLKGDRGVMMRSPPPAAPAKKAIILIIDPDAQQSEVVKQVVEALEKAGIAKAETANNAAVPNSAIQVSLSMREDESYEKIKLLVEALQTAGVQQLSFQTGGVRQEGKEAQNAIRLIAQPHYTTEELHRVERAITASAKQSGLQYVLQSKIPGQENAPAFAPTATPKEPEAAPSSSQPPTETKVFTLKGCTVTDIAQLLKHLNPDPSFQAFGNNQALRLVLIGTPEELASAEQTVNRLQELMAQITAGDNKLYELLKSLGTKHPDVLKLNSELEALDAEIVKLEAGHNHYVPPKRIEEFKTPPKAAPAETEAAAELAPNATSDFQLGVVLHRTKPAEAARILKLVINDDRFTVEPEGDNIVRVKYRSATKAEVEAMTSVLEQMEKPEIATQSTEPAQGTTPAAESQSAPSDPESMAEEASRLIGPWRNVQRPGHSMVIYREGDQLLFHSEDGVRVQSGTVHLDLATRPHRIRLEQVKDGSVFGIYKWISESNTQERPDRFIMLVQEKDYPSETDLEKEDGDRYEFERESLKRDTTLSATRYPEPQGAPPRPVDEALLLAELTRFVGTWRPINSGDHQPMRLSRRGNKLNGELLETETEAEISEPMTFSLWLEVANTPVIVRRARFVYETDGDKPSVPIVYAFSEVNGKQRLTIDRDPAGILPKSIDESGPELKTIVYEKLPSDSSPNRTTFSAGEKVVLALSHDGNQAFGFSTETGAWVPLELDVNLIVPEPMVTADLGFITHGQRCYAFDGVRLTWATLTLPPSEQLTPEVRGKTISVYSPTRGDLVFKEGWGKWFTSEEVQAGKVEEHLAQADSKSPDSPSPALPVTDTPITTFENHPSVIPNLLRACARIRVTTDGKLSKASGTIIESGGETIVLTCSHIFRGMTDQTSIEVELFDSHRPRTYVATLLGHNPEADVALIQFDTSREIHGSAEIAPLSLIPSVGNEVISIGCIRGESPTSTSRKIVQVNQFKGADNLTCTGLPEVGEAGGGLFNEHGQLIGVCTAADGAAKQGVYCGLGPIHELIKRHEPAHLNDAAAKTLTPSPSSGGRGEPEASTRETNQKLATAVAKAMQQAGITGNNIQIEVSDGVCALTGKWRTPEDRTRAEKLARITPGITSVQNHPLASKTPEPAPAVSAVKVFALQHAQATEVAEVLKQVYDQGPSKIVPDARTNSVIVTGPEGQLKEIEALLLKLDESGQAPPSAAIQKLRDMLPPLRIERAMLLTELGDKHPKVTLIDTQISSIQNEIQNLQSQSPTVRGVPIDLEAAQRVAQLQGELAKLLQTLGPEHPKVKELQARLDAASAKSHAASQEPSTHGIRNQMVQHSPPAEVAAKLQQLYKEGPFTISSDAQANTVVVSGPADRLLQVADIIGILDQALAPSRTSGGLDAVKAAIGHLEVRKTTLEAQQKEHDRIQKLAKEGVIPLHRVEESTRDLSAAQHYAEVATVELQATQNQFKADLLSTMEESLEYSQKILPSDHNAIREAETQIAGIVAQADTSPEEAQKAAGALSSNLEAEAVKMVEAGLKSLESELTPGLPTRSDDHVKYLKQTLAQLRRRERARTLVPGASLPDRNFSEQSEDSFDNREVSGIDSVEEAAARASKVNEIIRELEKEREAVIAKNLGKHSPRVDDLDASIAQIKADNAEVLVSAMIQQSVAANGLKEVVSLINKGIIAERAERDKLIETDPTNPRIREIDIDIASSIVKARNYEKAIAAAESGVSPGLPDFVPLNAEVREASAKELQQQVIQLRKDYEAADAQAHQLAEQLKESPDDAKQAELRKVVQQAFTARQSLLRAELMEMQTRLLQTQRSIEMRERISDQIIQRRVEDLLNPQLEWEGSPSAPGQPVSQTGSRKALVALKDIRPGHRLTEENVQLKDVSVSDLESMGDDFVKTLEEYQERSVTKSVVAGDVIRKSKLSEQGAYSVSAQIPRGMRIFTFPTTDIHTHSGMLRPGDRVDVTVSFTTREERVVNKVLLECVQVFACDNRTANNEENKHEQHPRYLTLLVTPEQDGVIKIGQSRGQLALALRHPDDDEINYVGGINSSVLQELNAQELPLRKTVDVATPVQQARWRSGVVELVFERGNGGRFGRGIIVSREGLVLTHLEQFPVVDPPLSISGFFDDGTQVTFEIVENAGNGFLTLMTKEKVQVQYAFPLSTAEYSVEDEVFLGGGEGSDLAVLPSRILMIDRQQATGPSPIWQVERNPSSGTILSDPVISANGELVALTLMREVGSDALLAVPMEKLRALLPESLGKLPIASALKPTAAPAAPLANGSPDPQAEMLAQLQGKWHVSIWEPAPLSLPKQGFEEAEVVVEGTLMKVYYTEALGANLGEGTPDPFLMHTVKLSVNETGTPQPIDLLFGPNNELVNRFLALGIAEYSDDVIRLCFDRSPGSKSIRPEVFASGEKAAIWELRRTPPVDSKAGMLARLQGRWVAEFETDPNAVDPAEAKHPGIALDASDVVFDVSGNVVTTSYITPHPDKPELPEWPVFSLQLGGIGKPQPVDLLWKTSIDPEGADFSGIIEFSGEEVRLCFGDVENRPRTFAAVKDYIYLVRLKRPSRESALHLGVQPAASPVGPDLLKDTPFRGGLRIEKVYAGTPAAEGGLLAGDILVGLGAWEVAKLEDLQYALGLSLEGEVSFHVLRDGQVRKGYVLLDGSKRPVSDAELSPEQLVKFAYEYQRGHSTPASQSEPQAALLAQLQGTWDVDLSDADDIDDLPPGTRAEFKIEGSLLKLWYIIPPRPEHNLEAQRIEAGAMLLTLGAAGPPQQIGLVIGPNDGDKRRETQGIIEITGDTVKLCYDPQKEKGAIQRPAAFAKGKQATMWTLIRSQASAQATELEGDWKLESFRSKDGTVLNPNHADAPQLEIRGNEVFYDSGRNPSKIEIDAEWKTMKYQKDSEDEPSTYRYLLKGDQLTLRNAGESVLVYRRQTAPPSTGQTTELDGDWHRVAVTAVDGTPIETPHFNVTIRGTTWTNQIGQTPEVIKFHTNLEKKTIEFSSTPPVLYAYELDGNRMVLRDKSLTMVLERGHIPAVVVAATELEGDWHLAGEHVEQGMISEIQIRPSNLTIRGDKFIEAWSGHQMEYRLEADPKTGEIRKYSLHEEPSFQPEKYERQGDRLILRDIQNRQNYLIYKRGHVRLQVALPQVTDTQRQKWRSGIVELFAEWNDEKTETQQKPIGYGTVISDQGWVVGQVERIGPDTRKYLARCDDGSLVPLDLKEDDVNGGWYVFQAQSSTQFSHAFPIALTETEVGDAVWAYPTNSTLLLVTTTLTAKDRRVVASGLPVWQLDRRAIPAEYSETRYGSLPILNGNGELLGLSMVGTGELSLALPVSQFKTVFTKTLGQLPAPTAPAEPTDADQTRWRSAMVDLYATKPGEDESHATRIGDGVLVTGKAEIVAYLPGVADLASQSLKARFADGGEMDLELGEPSTRTTGNGMYCFRPKDERFRTVPDLLPFLPLAAEVPNQNVDRLYIGELFSPATISHGADSPPGDLGIVNEHFANMWRMTLQPRTVRLGGRRLSDVTITAGDPILSRDGHLVGMMLSADPEFLALPVAELKELFPKTFASQPTAEVAPAAKPRTAEEIASRLKALQGTWTVDFFDGPDKDKSGTPLEMIVSGNQLTMVGQRTDEAGQVEVRNEVVQIDLTDGTDERAIDLFADHLPGREPRVTLHCIYEIDGNKLAICLKKDGPRPTEFGADAMAQTTCIRCVRKADVPTESPSEATSLEPPPKGQ